MKSAALIGALLSSKQSGAVRITSIMLTAVPGTDSVLKIYPYDFATGDALITVAAPAKTTAQVIYKGVPMPDGVVIVPDANCASYVVEYDSGEAE